MLKALHDCDYTAFISYAHADDVAWFRWVSEFRKELELGLAARLRGTRLPGLHLSDANGPVSGMLSDELKERIAASYAMVIVVHDNYAHSDWCLKELEYFKDLFGEEGLRERLYIVALSESAIDTVTRSAAWQRLMPGGEQLWVRFYDELDKEHPLAIYADRGNVAAAFREQFGRLREDLVRKLKKAALPAPAGAAAAAPARSAPAPAVSALTLFGFTPPELQDDVAALVGQLAQRAAVVGRIGADAVLQEFAAFAGAGRLVLAFDDAPLMLGFYPGGHLAMQRDSWLKSHPAADSLMWLDLRADAAAPSQGAAAWVGSLGVTVLTPAALLDRLCPPTPLPGTAGQLPEEGVHIYIESNRNERTLWEPLGEQIRRKWDEIVVNLDPARAPPLYLRTRGLPVDQIDTFPPLEDADGVVLLWGKKTPDALWAQINKVERKLPGRDGAPGIVAYLMPPQTSDEPLADVAWHVLRFDIHDQEHIDIVEQDELKRFLKKVLERQRRRTALRQPVVAVRP